MVLLYPTVEVAGIGVVCAPPPVPVSKATAKVLRIQIAYKVVVIVGAKPLLTGSV